MTKKRLYKTLIISSSCIAFLLMAILFGSDIKYKAIFSQKEYINKKIPLIKKGREGCLFCHSNVKGLSASHNPQAIGCSSCHRGDHRTLDKKKAHKGMIIPGNLSTSGKSCGQKDCHSDIVLRVKNSIMATGRGMVTVNKFAFKETSSPSGMGSMSKLDSSPSNIHLSQLCQNCHLNTIRKKMGPYHITETGGGCSACHLNYSSQSKKKYGPWKKKKTADFIHPSLTIKIKNNRCFNCHSRSARISTSYEGWYETLKRSKQKGKDIISPNKRILPDGRVFAKKNPDLHHKSSMTCIDCHTSKGLMGNGKAYNFQKQQVVIQCEDCHKKRFNFTINNHDRETNKLLQLKGEQESRKTPGARKNNEPLLNIYRAKYYRPYLLTKITKKRLPLKPPSLLCGTKIKEHKKLSCISCHSSWAPTCVGCHTQYKKSQSFNPFAVGKWSEYRMVFTARKPSLGIITHNKKEKISTFTPAMVMTIGGIKNKEKKLSNKLTYSVFQRLYAPGFYHTITKKGRSCKSCHSDPSALGFGRGTIKFTEHNPSTWVFKNFYDLHTEDKLPEDAWIPFLKKDFKAGLARKDIRPFSYNEQVTILQVGRCLQCHKGNESMFLDFKKSLKRMKNTCFKRL